MLPRRTFGTPLALLLALLFGVGLGAVNIGAQTTAPPLSKEVIIEMLKSYVTSHQVAMLARQRGINFQMTPLVESELRRAGATTELPATLREIAPNPPTANPEAPLRTVSAPAALTVRENPKDGLKYVWIPPGTFMMGCSPGGTECENDEKPAHRVTITRGFWIGQTLVTAAAYQRFVGATGRQMPAAPDFNTGWANANMPIVGMTWDDAQEYCRWMGGRLGTERAINGTHPAAHRPHFLLIPTHHVSLSFSNIY